MLPMEKELYLSACTCVEKYMAAAIAKEYHNFTSDTINVCECLPISAQAIFSSKQHDNSSITAIFIPKK